MVYTLTFEYEFAREINTGKEHPISEFYLINRFSPRTIKRTPGNDAISRNWEFKI